MEPPVAAGSPSQPATADADVNDVGVCTPTGGERSELPAILTVDEVASLLRLNRKTVYEALARGEIPGARRIGRTYRIARSALLGWLSDGQVRVPRSRRHP